MNKEKLAEIGSKLDVSESDIASIRKRHRHARIIAPVTGGLIVFYSTVIGYIVGSASGTKAGNDAWPKLVNSKTGEVYPYMIPVLLGLASGISASDLRRKTKFIILFTSVLTVIFAVTGYLLAHGMAYENAYEAARGIQYYSGAIEYGVYSKEE